MKKKEFSTTAVGGLLKAGASAALIGAVVTLLGIAITALLLHGEQISWNKMQYGVFATLLIASVAASWWLIVRNGRKWSIVVTGVIALLLLYALVDMVLFDGMFNGLLPAAPVILAGCLIPFLLQGTQKKKTKFHPPKR